MTAKKIMEDIILKLNKAGFSGGFYFYKKNECSCCYGLENTFFEINENIPSNWGIYGTNKFYYKISFKTGNQKEATRFRSIANKLVKKGFGRMAETAKSNFEAITINI